MITINWLSFWSDEKENEEKCKIFMSLVIKIPNTVKQVIEDVNDPESNTELIFQYFDLTIDTLDVWDELRDFAREMELYVIVYDHSSNDRKGYWYDEDEIWVLQNFGPITNYDKLID